MRLLFSSKNNQARNIRSMLNTEWLSRFVWIYTI